MKIKKRVTEIVHIIIFCTAALTAVAKNGPGPTETANQTLTGIVTDKADTAALPGVTVSIPDLRIGTATDGRGHYTLNRIPKGIYLVSFSYVGYKTYTVKVDFSKTTRLDVQMMSSAIETGEVVITGVTRATEIKRDPVPMVAINK